MFRVKRLNDSPSIPYCAKYGRRSGLRTSKNETSVVDMSFLRPRETPEVNKNFDPSPEQIDKMLSLIHT